MTELVFVENGQAVTDSLTVAQVFGKAHDKVMRDIRELNCSDHFRLANFGESEYVNSQNKTMPRLLIKRDGLAFLVFGYTGAKAADYKEKYIAAFNQMEEALKQPRALTDKEQRIELLKLSLEHEERLEEYDNRLAKLEDNVRIDAFQQTVIQKQIGARVYKVHAENNPQELELKKLFPMMHRNLRDAFGVPTYKDIRKLDFEDALAWVKSWRPLI